MSKYLYLVQPSLLQEGDGIIQNLKKRKVKWHKNCALNFQSQSKSNNY